jgi:hypothetical protein
MEGPFISPALLLMMPNIGRYITSRLVVGIHLWYLLGILQSAPTRNSWQETKRRTLTYFFFVRQPNLKKRPVGVHAVAVYTFAPDVGQRLEQTCTQPAVGVCLDTHPRRAHVTQACFQV